MTLAKASDTAKILQKFWLILENKLHPLDQILFLTFSQSNPKLSD